MAQQPALIRGLHNLRPAHRGTVATIGTFDGVHLGHQAVLAQLREAAAQYQLPTAVITFEPQPFEYFFPDKAPARLMPLREKVETFFAAGIDQVLCLPFNERLRQLTAQAFIDRILRQGLDVRYLVVGDDFRFGADRAGDFDLLSAVGAREGFAVVDTPTVLRDGQRVSSTRIRRLLQSGAFAEAERLLGRPYQISGRVRHGQQLGRQLGFPTANIALHRYAAPLAGVYAVEAEGGFGRCPAVANLGVRPTIIGDHRPQLEVHLFDFSGDLYGQRLRVTFRHKLRDEQRFASLEALQHQVKEDMAAARALLGAES